MSLDKPGVIMIIFLDEAYERWQREGRLRSMPDLRKVIIEGAVQRVRPKIMTASAILIGLLPIMWSHGAGADVMKRIAAPMIGGMVSSILLTLLVIPAIYLVWRGRAQVKTEKSLKKSIEHFREQATLPTDVEGAAR